MIYLMLTLLQTRSYPLCWKILLPRRVWGPMRAATGVPLGSVVAAVLVFAAFLY